MKPLDVIFPAAHPPPTGGGFSFASQRRRLCGAFVSVVSGTKRKRNLHLLLDFTKILCTHLKHGGQLWYNSRRERHIPGIIRAVNATFQSIARNARRMRVVRLHGILPPPPSARDGRNVGHSARRTRRIRGPFPNHRFSLGGSRFAATDSHSSFLHSFMGAGDCPSAQRCERRFETYGEVQRN